MIKRDSAKENVLRFLEYVKCYPRQSLYLLPGNEAWNKRVVGSLLKEKYIGVYNDGKRKGVRSLRVLKRGRQRLGSEHGGEWDSRGERQRIIRQHRIGETVAFFDKTGAEICPGVKPEKDWLPPVPTFWSVMEFKDSLEAARNLSYTRFMGVYWDGRKKYMVYHTGAHPISWSERSEVMACSYLEHNYFGRGLDREIKDHIILGESYDTALEILNNTRKNKLNSAFGNYDNKYFFPISKEYIENTIWIFKFKQNPKWQWLPNIILGEETVNRGKDRIIGDGLTESNEPVLFLFDMNLDYMRRLRTYGERGPKPIVYYFNEQVPLMKAFWGDGAKLMPGRLENIEEIYADKELWKSG